MLYMRFSMSWWCSAVVQVVAVALVYNYRLPSRDRRLSFKTYCRWLMLAQPWPASRHNLWVDLARRAPWPGDRGEMKGRGWAELSKLREDSRERSMMGVTGCEVQENGLTAPRQAVTVNPG